MILIYRLITTLGLLIAITWLYVDPKFDSVFATAIALAAVIALFITTKKMKRLPSQSQVVTNNSSGIQAGGNVNMGSVDASRKKKNAE
ncbi:MAG: hypothetical protein V4446_06410 [Pseudomonadota bacterium]